MLIRMANKKYGLGASDDEKRAGKGTQAYHESQHVKDLIAFFSATAPPEPAFKIGMTRQEVEKALGDYKGALSAYVRIAEQYTIKKTDEAGPLPKSFVEQRERNPRSF
jgi:hypothetical protein